MQIVNEMIPKCTRANLMLPLRSTVKPVLSGHSKRRPKMFFKINGSILQHFRPSLSYYLSFRPLFCLLLSGCLRQVLTCLKQRSIRRPKMVFKNDYLLTQVKSIAEWDHSAILSTLIKLPFVIKIFVLSILSGRLRQVLPYIQISPLFG